MLPLLVRDGPWGCLLGIIGWSAHKCRAPLGAFLGQPYHPAMDIGHRHPSEFVLRFAQRTDHPMTQTALLAELKQNHATEWPRIWGTLWGHRGVRRDRRGRSGGGAA